MNSKGKIDYYNFNFFFACISFFIILSVSVLLPGNFVIALLILESAFRLSCKFLIVTLINIMLFDNLVQSIGARISSC